MRDRYTKLINIIGLGGAAFFLGALFAYGFFVEGELSDRSGDWGTFGDFVGGFAGTGIAICTLLALLANLRLQSKELAATSNALDKQVAASNKQLALIEGNETLRVQPVLKVEWFATQLNVRSNFAILRITNIGFGPCKMERVHVFVGDDEMGTHDLDDWEAARDVWHNTMQRAVPDKYGGTGLSLDPMNKYRKLLAPGEPQRLLQVNFGSVSTARDAVFTLQQDVRVEIEFSSTRGVEMSTTEQELLFVKQFDPEVPQNPS